MAPPERPQPQKPGRMKPTRRAPAAWRTAADPRRLGAWVLCELEQRGGSLDRILEEELEERPTLADRRDRDLFQAIVFGTLRRRPRIDRLIGRASKRPLAALDPPVLALLRVALFQVLFFDRVPASAAVNAAVEAAKEISPWIASFVNAVLRKASQGNADPDPAPADAASRLAIDSGLPPWLSLRWIARWGEARTAALAAAINEIPSLTLRTNTLKVDRDGLIARLRSDAETVLPARLSPVGVHVRGLRPRVADTAAFREGLFQVQDEASQLVGALLAPAAGERVLDLCAGRGGKTGHIAQLMENTGELFALDKSANRLDRLSREMERLGVRIVSCQAADLLKLPAEGLKGPFQRVLLDAPCSGLGTIRRNPDIRWSTDEGDFPRRRATQRAFLSAATRLVSPGGVLVYAVCSPEPEEGVEVIEGFLREEDRFEIDRHPEDVPREIRALLDERGFLQTWPGLQYMDGFFAARLRRKG